MLLMASKTPLILRRPQSGRLEGRRALVQIEIDGVGELRIA